MDDHVIDICHNTFSVFEMCKFAIQYLRYVHVKSFMRNKFGKFVLEIQINLVSIGAKIWCHVCALCKRLE